MIRRPPRSTLDRSAAASDVYKRQVKLRYFEFVQVLLFQRETTTAQVAGIVYIRAEYVVRALEQVVYADGLKAVSYTHLRAHETVLDIVCRLLLEKKKP